MGMTQCCMFLKSWIEIRATHKDPDYLICRFKKLYMFLLSKIVSQRIYVYNRIKKAK